MITNRMRFTLKDMPLVDDSKRLVDIFEEEKQIMVLKDLGP
jgi:hypothetical protein